MLYFYFTERKHTRENYYIYRKVMPFVVFTRIASDVGVGANCNPGSIPPFRNGLSLCMGIRDGCKP